MERFVLNVTMKGKEALERICAFNPDKPRIHLVSEILIEAAKAYKGRKPIKKLTKTSNKTVKKGR